MTDPARRVMDRIGEKTYLPVLNVEESDALPLLGLPILGLVLGSRVHDLAAFPGVLLGLGLGIAIVHAAPAHLTATTWLRDLLRYYLKRPQVTTSAPAGRDGSSTHGGLAGYTPFAVDEDTRDLTGLRRALGGAGAIERDDGAIEGWIEVSPRNMDFAMSDEWATLQEAMRQFANDDLTFDLTLFATTRPFPADQLVETLDDRLDDPDVASNAVFRELLTEYRQRRPAELTGVREIRYFVGVEVTRREVYEHHDAEETPLERLATLPVVGPLLVEQFVSRRAGLDESELRERMVRKLDDRLALLEDGYVRETTGWDARRLSALEVFLLAMDFWNGTNHATDPDDNAHLMNRTPAAAKLSREGDGGDRR